MMNGIAFYSQESRPFQSLFWRVCRRRGSATGKVAVARKLLTIIYAMVRFNLPNSPQLERVFKEILTSFSFNK